MTDRRDDDFADVAEDLTAVLSDLRDELEAEAPRGPFGLPRPPSPGEVLRFTDEVAIPGTIAILEANITLLETVQRAIRLAQSGRETRDRADDAADRVRDSAGSLASASDRTLRRLERSLSDLQTALENGPTPESRAGQELLDEARALRDEVQSRLRDASRDRSLSEFEDAADDADRSRRADADERHERIDVTSPSGDGDAAGDRSDATESRRGDVQVDVDAELETLKEHYGSDEDSTDAEEDDTGADGPDETGSTDEDGNEPASDGAGADPDDDGADDDDAGRAE